MKKLIKTEENNWYDFPQKIKYWKQNIDYVMFIDENGNSGAVNKIFQKKLNGLTIGVDEKYFTITGCIFKRKEYSIMRNNIRKLKAKYWPNGGYFYDTKHKNTRYVCFHSREIRMHTVTFNESLINYEKFINELSDLLANVDCKIISITINLEEYIVKNETLPIYEKALDLLLERYVYATDSSKKGIIILESRGKKDDGILLKHVSDIINKKGIKDIKHNELSDKIVGVYFNPKWYSEYSSTYAGLEIADLFSYPIHQQIKYNNNNRAFKLIENKIDYSTNCKAKGIKKYPKEKNEIHRS